MEGRWEGRNILGEFPEVRNGGGCGASSRFPNSIISLDLSSALKPNAPGEPNHSHISIHPNLYQPIHPSILTCISYIIVLKVYRPPPIKKALTPFRNALAGLTPSLAVVIQASLLRIYFLSTAPFSPDFPNSPSSS